MIFRCISDPNVVGASRRGARPGRPEGLETSDVSFVRLSSRSVLLIANKLMSDFFLLRAGLTSYIVRHFLNLIKTVMI